MDNDFLNYYESHKMQGYTQVETVYKYVYDDIGFIGAEAKALVEMYLKRAKDYEKSKMMGINRNVYDKLQDIKEIV